MGKCKIGVLEPAEIAVRRFLPAVKLGKRFDFAGIAVASNEERNLLVENTYAEYATQKSKEKAEKAANEFGGAIFDSFEQMLNSDDIQAVYIPLPPALHYFWAKKALKRGKHVFLEKPFTTKLSDTTKLINLAGKSKLALHENYAFCFHEQINKIIELINNGEIGEVRLIRSAFGFPYRGAGDFRYNKALGGGALLDCGGYPIKLSSLLLGDTSRVTAAFLSVTRNHDVDIFGSCTLTNEKGLTSQVAFGMDNAYKCEVEIWGSRGLIYAPRIFTAPSDFSPEIVLKNEQEYIITVSASDQFLCSLDHFYCCIVDSGARNKAYGEIRQQGRHIKDIYDFSNKEDNR